MENSGQKPPKKNFITLVIGILLLMLACLFFSGAVMLDLVGAKATGKLSNAAKSCSSGKTCWTGKMAFTTPEGEQVSFYPLTAPMLFDFDPLLSGRSYAEYGEYQVRYFASYPKLAKVKLAFFLEYLNMLCGFGLGGILTLIGLSSVRGRGSDKAPNPLVLDLSKWRKK
jgi:hypothetical protein